VVFCLYLNDVDDNIRQPLFDIDRGSLIPLDARKTSLYLTGQLAHVTPALLRSTRSYDLLQSSLLGRDPFGLVPSLGSGELHRWSLDKIALEIQGLDRMAQSDGFELLVLGMPFHGVSDGYTWWPDVAQLEVWSRDLSREGVWNEKQGLFFTRDAHPTREGNRVLAETVHGLLVNHRF
jgi:hypothetical protein